jgi:hypothetical protein
MQATNDGLVVLPLPKAAHSPLHYAFCCFPPASPIPASWAGKQKTAPMGRSKPLISLKESGAGEGVRTLDPNLGKVNCLDRRVCSLTTTATGGRGQPRRFFPACCSPDAGRGATVS